MYDVIGSGDELTMGMRENNSMTIYSVVSSVDLYTNSYKTAYKLLRLERYHTAEPCSNGEV